MCSNEINGVLNVLKPPGMTSHDVVKFLRRVLGVKKAGHTGTLDPGVAGVLPVCLGKATKIIEYMADDIKQYRAEAAFGRSTDTQDGFGRTLTESDASALTEKQVTEALLSMQGVQSQVPPMVSAVKHQGRRLYELAREGVVVERQPRTIKVHQIEIIRCSGFGTPNPAVLFDIRCSRGTYVRTICHDLGKALGYGGFMSFLVRTGTGRFHISEALILEEISDKAAGGTILENILPVDRVLPLPAVWVDDNAVKSVTHGNRVFASGVQEAPEDLEEGGLVKLMNSQAGCLAVAEVSYDGQSLENNRRYIFQPVKVFC